MVRKPIAFVLMVISLLGVFSPVVLHAAPSEQGSVLMTLDVCHASIGLLNTAADLPVIHENPVVVTALTVAGRAEPLSMSSYQLLVAFQDERPPKS